MDQIPVIDQAIKNSDSESKKKFKAEVLFDYWTACLSREISLIGRKEVLTGKAKFGILGDGKELPQLALARYFKKGDFRSGYYRDQTFMLAKGLSTVEDYFAQLYADTENDPFSHGRQMNAHFATPLIDENDEWLEHSSLYNVTADVSPTAGQMARALGIALASKKYRAQDSAPEKFSLSGNEISFCTIGDASTSEGIFWETINAAVVMKVPLFVCVWDDGYGISVPKDLQTGKGSISDALSGLAAEDGEGMEIYRVKAWDYTGLMEVFELASKKCREEHIPVLLHVEECTQPQGHSTSGSHERYKDSERLEWEDEYDCIRKFEEWIVETGIETPETLEKIRTSAINDAREGKRTAWETCRSSVDPMMEELLKILDAALNENPSLSALKQIKREISSEQFISISSLTAYARKMNYAILGKSESLRKQLQSWISERKRESEHKYHTHLYSETRKAAIQVNAGYPEYKEDSSSVPGHKILNTFFDDQLKSMPELYVFGEDVGKIGDVNQGFAGMQEKYGKDRVFDVGIREWSIVGQAIGMAMRGLRPIAEIQYLDYLIYALSALSDDLATLRYRSNGIQMAPAIIRTRGHRLEGIWHAGSPLGMILNSLRGMHVVVPRDMTRATGFYKTLMSGTDPGLVIESLNGYRLREKMPSNLGEYALPLGIPETILQGSDITVLTYGSMVRVVRKAAMKLKDLGIEVELLDLQTLLPFDLEHRCLESLKKTNRLLIVDEDLPGAASAYILREVLEKQSGYYYLDNKPETLTARAHRTPFGSDGDYFTKPNEQDVLEKIYAIMRESNVKKFPYSF